MNNIKIFIVIHKKTKLPIKEGYYSIQVVSEGKEKIGYVSQYR